MPLNIPDAGYKRIVIIGGGFGGFGGGSGGGGGASGSWQECCALVNVSNKMIRVIQLLFYLLIYLK